MKKFLVFVKSVSFAKRSLLNRAVIMFLTLITASSYGQKQETSISKWRISANAGLYGSIFLLNSADNNYAPTGYFRDQPPRFLGYVGGLGLARALGKNWWLQFDGQRTMNSRRQSFVSPMFGTPNSVEVKNLVTRESSIFLNLGAQKQWLKGKHLFNAEGGITYQMIQGQFFDYFQGVFTIGENSYFDKNGGDIGPFLGVGYSRKIDQRLSIGLQSRVYFMLGGGEFEGVSLSPTVSYSF